MSNKKEIAIVGPNVPKEIQDRLRAKLMDKNDDKIIEKMQQIQSHKDSIARLSKEVEDMINPGF